MAKVKSIKPSVGVGWHIWHNNSFSPIYRAEQDLSELTKYSDFLKMVMYHNCGGERMASYIRSVGATMYGDVPQQELLDFHYRVLDYKEEKPLADIPKSGPVRRLRLPRSQARPRSAERDQDAAVAGNRHRHSDRADAEQVQPGRHPGRSAGGLPRGERRGSAFAQVLGDEAGEPARRRRAIKELKIP